MSREEKIAQVTGRLIEYFRPERIYLFGSAARGDWGADSDLDFCVVLPDGAPERFFQALAHAEALNGIGTAVDVIRLPIRDFDLRAAHVAASLPATIVREGQLLYDARRFAA